MDKDNTIILQHRLPCFTLRLDTTSTRYLEIQSKLFSSEVSRNNSHSTVMTFCLRSRHYAFGIYFHMAFSACNSPFGDLSLDLQYQVPVVHGERLEWDKVAETCERAGMKAVCAGDEGCSWNNASRQVSDESVSTVTIPTIHQVCDHTTQHRLCFLGKQEHFKQGVTS